MTARFLSLCAASLSLALPVHGGEPTLAPAREIRYRSDADGTDQPAMFYAPKADEPAPLLVVLHSWSGDYRQTSQADFLKGCVDRGWVFIHPDFRGMNVRPEATGSELVVKDILSAVAHARKAAKVDPTRIYLTGGSGGGYASLLMAGRAPELWAGVSAWVPITDLAAWHGETKKANLKYWKDLEKSCGGPPGVSPAVDAQYRRRSVLTHLAAAKGVPLDINAGIHDGHTGSVPVSHSLNAFNLLAAPADRVSKEDVAFLVREAKVPPHLQAEVKDPTYGVKTPLFRRTSGAVRVTLFDGGHEVIPAAALHWLQRQRKGP